ncbi:xaa-Pro dipeptidase [Ligilactobacillus araffinosus DSM 20653]|uniref:Xaa-Pro dipeptidase n=2 Tax=Ligilactobacillus araffinosus TaxID=147809 RepID=A0A0R1ZC25_9LACO|nr:xaa-Pro dipeptidase [Ligilactobacillus araffinosus DSM 20653]
MMNKTEYHTRISKVRNFIGDHHMDGFLVTNPVNINYLSGFTGDEGLLLITDQTAYLISDARFQVELMTQTITEYRITSDYYQTACQLFEQDHLVAVGFEASISYHDYDYLDENSVADIVPTENLIEYFRSIKSDAEIQILKKAASLAKKGYFCLLTEILKLGLSEKEVANRFDFEMRQLGADKASFDPIIATGIENTVKPHSVNSSRKIQVGDLILVDYGYFYQGYTFDVTRVCGMGTQSPEIHRLTAAVQDALLETMQIVAPGLPFSALWQKANAILKNYHLNQYFTHGIGHGIGRSIHEMPTLSYRSDELLQVGQVITIEPGVYVPGVGGIRLENDLLVTANGFENLTDFDLGLTEL